MTVLEGLQLTDKQPFVFSCIPRRQCSELVHNCESDQPGAFLSEII
jgi:hypothetical protein